MRIRLEAPPRFSGLARLSDTDLDRRIVDGLNVMVTNWPSSGAMVLGLDASPHPADKELAGQIQAFIAGWHMQQR